MTNRRQSTGRIFEAVYQYPHGNERVKMSDAGAGEWNLFPEDRKDSLTTMKRFISEIPEHSFSPDRQRE